MINLYNATKVTYREIRKLFKSPVLLDLMILSTWKKLPSENVLKSALPCKRKPAEAWRSYLENVYMKILQNSQENARASDLQHLAQVFSSEFCEILKNTFF